MTPADNSNPNETTTTEEIIREAQRRIEHRQANQIPPSPRDAGTLDRTPPRQQVVLGLKRGVRWLADHWVAVLNVFILIYLAGAVAPPFLIRLGASGPANVLYALYKPFCHQYPFRSWFVFGNAAFQPLDGPKTTVEMNDIRDFIGNADVGYKMALCQRDIAIYGAMLLAGIVYGVLHRRIHLPPLPLWLYFVLGIMPMMLDGGVQLLSYLIWEHLPGLLAQPFETIPLMRTLTGTLFGLGVIGVGYPYLGEYFDDVQGTLQARESEV